MEFKIPKRRFPAYRLAGGPDSNSKLTKTILFQDFELILFEVLFFIWRL